MNVICGAGYEHMHKEMAGRIGSVRGACLGSGQAGSDFIEAGAEHTTMLGADTLQDLHHNTPGCDQRPHGRTAIASESWLRHTLTISQGVCSIAKCSTCAPQQYMQKFQMIEEYPLQGTGAHKVDRASMVLEMSSCRFYITS